MRASSSPGARLEAMGSGCSCSSMVLRCSRTATRSAGAANNRQQRIADAGLGAAIERLNVAPVSGLLQVALDEPRMAGVVERLPDSHGFGRKAPVREGDDQWSTAADDAPELAYDVHRMNEVLDGHADGRRVKRSILEFEQPLAIEVFHI